MGLHALEEFSRNYAEIRRWVKSPDYAPSASARNGLGALAEIVVALHLSGRLVGHDQPHDVDVVGVTYEVRTRADGRKPDYSGKLADRFADVKFLVEKHRLRVVGLRTRPGVKLANDGGNPWEIDPTLRPLTVIF